MGTIMVVGSLNMDLVFRLSRWPEPDETVMGRSYRTVPGGKGANQAVAAARQGATACMVGCVGQDEFGQALLASLRAADVDVTGVRQASNSTGVALVGVEGNGQSRVIVVAGANRALTVHHVEDERQRLAACEWLLLQLEVPLEANIAAAQLARSLGTRVLLTPAPAPTYPLPEELLSNVDMIVPNRVEARALTGKEGPREAAHSLRALGVATVIVTLGAEGALLVNEAGEQAIAPFEVEAVDSTAAGDAFVGALAAALARGAPLGEATRCAAAAGALAVTKLGAQPSLPTLAAVESLIATAEGRPPAAYPEGLVTTFENREGAGFVLRPILPADAPRLKRTFAELSPESVYRRFFSQRRNLSDEEARTFATVDYRAQLALVATPQDDPTHLVGIARFAPTAERAGAVEMAIVVVDHWQGHGIGRRLFRELAASAHALGHRWMLVETQPDNQPMIELAESAGYPTHVEQLEGVLRLWLALSPLSDADAPLAH